MGLRPSHRHLSERDRRIVALAVPSLGTLAVEPLYVLIDTAIVGRLGVVPLGGLALASAVLTTLLLVCNFLAYGVTARVAFLTGQGDDRAAAGVAAQALWLSGLIGVPLAIGVLFGGRGLIGLLGAHGAIGDAASTYLRISVVGMPAVLVALVGHGYLRGRSDAVTPLKVALFANVLNVVLEVILVYGFHFGVAGSAWGTVVAELVAAAWFLVLLGRRVSGAHVSLRPMWNEMSRLLVAARHLFVRTAALLSTLALATAVATRLGPAVLGGHQITLQVHTFIGLALDSLAIPGQIMVGTLLGAGDRDEAAAVARRLVLVGVGCGLVAAGVLLALARVLPNAFTHDAAVRHAATTALVVAAVVQIPAAVAFVLDGVLIGGSDFRFLQWSMLAGLAVYLPFAAFVLRFHSLGVAGVWIGLLAWMTGRAGANYVRYRSRRWAEVTVS